MKAEEFGERIRSLRKQAKMTIRQLETYSGVSNSYLSQLENGKRGVPSPEILRKLSGPLRVPFSHLMKVAGYVNDESEIYTVDKEKILEILKSMDDRTKNYVTPDSIGNYKPQSSDTNAEREINILRDFGSGHLEMIPVLGSIRAGQPIEMIRDSGTEYELVERDLIHNYDAFILRVQGESMTGDQIYDGDRVVVIYTPDFSSSDICVVAIDGEEATLKRVKCQDDICVLTPSNPTMEPMVYPTKDIHVIGVVVEVRRRLKR